MSVTLDQLNKDLYYELFIEDYEHLKCDDTLEFYKRIIWDTVNNFDFSGLSEREPSTFAVYDCDENNEPVVLFAFTLDVTEIEGKNYDVWYWRLLLNGIYVYINDGSDNFNEEQKLCWVSKNDGIVLAEDETIDYNFHWRL